MPCCWRWPLSLHGVGSGHTRWPDVVAGVITMTMPAVVLTADRTIDFQERPRPSLRPDQVIVEVELCGICGSDLHAVSVDVAIECSGNNAAAATAMALL